MNCNQAKSELIAYIQGELSPEKKKRLEDHLARCPSCRRELEQAKRILDWTEAASSATIIRKVYDYVKQAIESGASDVHFEPQSDDTMRVRMRVDGVLREIDRLEAAERHGVTARLKMMADMSVAETGIAQQGRILVRMAEQDYVFRASSIPFVYGEGISIRLQPKASELPDLKQQVYPDQFDALMRIAGSPMGLVVVGGPGASGKSTVAYSLMSLLNSPEKNMVSVDDYAVDSYSEYSIAGVNHVRVNSRAGFDVSAAIRSVLLHDPDVILVNQFTEYETIQSSLYAALTGHLVLAVMTVNNAVSAISRLPELGADWYLLSSALAGVTNQRLARKTCEQCREPVELDLDDPMVKFLGITSEEMAGRTFYRGRGCGACHNTGYSGRTLIMEVLEVDREISKLIGNGASDAEILEAARARGFVSMREAGKRRVLDGTTTPEEAFRVLAGLEDVDSVSCEPNDEYNRALLRANEKAGELGIGYVTTEHLLYGLALEEGTVALKALELLGISRYAILEVLNAQMSVNESGIGAEPQEIQFTPRYRRILDLACDEARAMGDAHVGSEHLLLGILREGEGVGGMVLRALGAASLQRKLGITPEDVRGAIHKVR